MPFLLYKTGSAVQLFCSSHCDGDGSDPVHAGAEKEETQGGRKSGNSVGWQANF